MLGVNDKLHMQKVSVTNRISKHPFCISLIENIEGEPVETLTIRIKNNYAEKEHSKTEEETAIMQLWHN